MAIDAWLPVGYRLPDGSQCRATLYEGANWQILGTMDQALALIVELGLAERWLASGLLESGLQPFTFGARQLHVLTSGQGRTLYPVFDSPSPETKDEALAFALALKATRAIDAASPLHDAVYVERFSRLLPTYSISAPVPDDIVLGYWLTGGANVSVKAHRRVAQMLSWMSAGQLTDLLAASGLASADATASAAEDAVQPIARARTASRGTTPAAGDDHNDGSFSLPGRPALEQFFNEHVVDIVRNRARYKAFGIGFPSAVVLHGPPGCGKTFAVERLVDFLEWPSFSVDASTIASPYIHETSRKITGVFDSAMKAAPSVLIIDEMDAFLADRQLGNGHHRVEEVAEFLRRIPEATRNDVLVIAMTNRIETIDPAILRRGRFDHILTVDYATPPEVEAMIEKLLSNIPAGPDIDPATLAKQLGGRPLSDVAFVMREGGRVAAKAGKEKLDVESIEAAMQSIAGRGREDASTRRIGFS